MKPILRFSTHSKQLLGTGRGTKIIIRVVQDLEFRPDLGYRLQVKQRRKANSDVETTEILTLSDPRLLG